MIQGDFKGIIFARLCLSDVLSRSNTCHEFHSLTPFKLLLLYPIAAILGHDDETNVRGIGEIKGSGISNDFVVD